MIERVAYRDWVLSCDPEENRRAYLDFGPAAAEACGCLPCRNFAAARHLAYPPTALSLLSSLGVDPPREAALYWVLRVAPGRHLYGAVIHALGRVEEEGAPATETHLPPGETEPLRFSLAAHGHPTDVRPCFGDRPVVQLELTAEVPWLADEPEPTD